MSGSGEDKARSPAPMRPQLVSHQSNSVPSTPQQHAQDSAFNDQPPSPGKRRSSTSPSSTKSDSRVKTQLRRGTASLDCRYMTTQTSRRRIPYSIGDQILESPRDPPRQWQLPEAKARLKASIDRLYNSLLPSESNQDARTQVLDKIRNIIRTGFPERKFDTHIFGSSGNLLHTDKSDVDICVTMSGLESTCQLAELLANNGMRNVRCVHATRVPIVKLWDPQLKLNCDLNINNHVALKNTSLVKAYIELDERIRPLAMIIKYWTKKRVINEASGGTLSSYTWTLLLINFLQTRSPPVLPRINPKNEDSSPRSDFHADVEKFRDFGKANEETLDELLFRFFRRYGFEIDYEHAVISVREANLLSKKHDKHWDRTNNNRLCVEEPFNIDRNLANTADDYAWRGLHLELRRAFYLIADGEDLDQEVAAQYEFPPNPKPVFERQQPLSRPPTLTRSLSQTSRGGRGTQSHRARGGYLGRDTQRMPGSNSRRASSAAAFGHTPFPLVQSSPQMGLPLEYVAQSQLQQSPHPNRLMGDTGMHEHLSQLHRQLSAQEQHLKQKSVQLANMASGGTPMRANFGSSVPSGRPPSLNGYQGYDRAATNDEVPVTAPLPQLSYPYVQLSGSRLTNGWTLPAQVTRGGTDTNPSSPLQTPLPLHRSMPRPQVSHVPTPRSQSQPARSPGPPSMLPNGFGMPMQQNGMSQAQQQYAIANVPSHQIVGQVMGADGQSYYIVDPSRTPSGPMEYLGYGFRNTPYYPVHGLNSMPVIGHTERRAGSWQTTPQYRQSTTTPTTAEQSRAPSPLRETATVYDGLRSAPLPQVPLQHQGLPFRHRPSEAGFSSMGTGSSYLSRSLGDELGNSARPRRVSDSVRYPQHSPTVWSANGTHYHSPPIGEPPLDSLQELDVFQSPLHRGRSMQSDAAQTDVGNDPFALSTRDSSRCSMQTAETGRSPLLQDITKANGHAASLPQNGLPPAAMEMSNGSATPATSSTNARKAIPHLDLPDGLSDRVNGDGPLTAAKVLSPVQETRTPSPPPKRLSRELADFARLNGSNGTMAAPRGRELPDPPTPLRKENQNGDRTVPPEASGTTWQQVVKKSAKRGKGSISEIDLGRSRGQPMPADVSQRKGG